MPVSEKHEDSRAAEDMEKPFRKVSSSNDG